MAGVEGFEPSARGFGDGNPKCYGLLFGVIVQSLLIKVMIIL